MKKVIVMLSIFALASCGGASTSKEVKDSTAVDSTVVVDSVAAADSAVVADTASAPKSGGGGNSVTPVK